MKISEYVKKVLKEVTKGLGDENKNYILIESHKPSNAPVCVPISFEISLDEDGDIANDKYSDSQCIQFDVEISLKKEKDE